MTERVLLPEVEAEFLERFRAKRRAAGLPEHITDPDVLDRIASIVLANRRENTASND